MFDNIRKLLFGEQSKNGSGNRGFGFRARGNNRCIYRLVNFEQARNMIENDNVTLIDVRTDNEYEFMHIKNAINIPVEEIEERVLEIDKEKSVMVYCASGARSKKAIQILNNLGYTNISIWEYGALATFPYRDLIEYGEKKEN